MGESTRPGRANEPRQNRPTGRGFNVRASRAGGPAQQSFAARLQIQPSVCASTTPLSRNTTATSTKMISR